MNKKILLILLTLFMSANVYAATATTDGCYYCSNYNKVLNAEDNYTTQYKYFKAEDTLDTGCNTTAQIDYLKTDNLEEACVHKSTIVEFDANGGIFTNGTSHYIMGCTDKDTSGKKGGNCSWDWKAMNSLVSRDEYEFDCWDYSNFENPTSDCSRYIKGSNNHSAPFYAKWIDKSKTSRGLDSEDLIAPSSGCYYCVDYEQKLGPDGYKTKYKYFEKDDKLTHDCNSTTINNDYHPGNASWCVENSHKINVTGIGSRRCFSNNNICKLPLIGKYEENDKFFYGWSTSKNRTNCINPNTKVNYSEYDTLYACLDDKNGIIYFKSNGGVYDVGHFYNSASSIEADYYPKKCDASDNKCDLSTPSNLYTKEGYTLTGWSTSEDMTNCISPETKVDYSKYDELYACWTAITPPTTSTSTTTTTKEDAVTHPSITLPSNSQNNNNNSSNNSNNSNNSNSNTTIESPKTGVEDYILISFLLVVLVGISLVLINNKKHIFKKI